MSKEFKLIANEQADYSTDIVILSVHNEGEQELFKKSRFLDYDQDNKIRSVRILNKKDCIIKTFQISDSSSGCYAYAEDEECREVRYTIMYFMKYHQKWITLYMCLKGSGVVWIDVFRNMLYYYVNYINDQTLEEFRSNGIW